MPTRGPRHDCGARAMRVSVDEDEESVRTAPHCIRLKHHKVPTAGTQQPAEQEEEEEEEEEEVEEEVEVAVDIAWASRVKWLVLFLCCALVGLDLLYTWVRHDPQQVYELKPLLETSEAGMPQPRPPSVAPWLSSPQLYPTPLPLSLASSVPPMLLPMPPPSCLPSTSPSAAPLTTPPKPSLSPSPVQQPPLAPSPVQPPPAPSPVQPPSPVSPTPMQPYCISEMRADGVQSRDEGPTYGTSDPVLWVFETEGSFATVQKTGVQLNTVTPRWEDIVCIDLPGTPLHAVPPCFEIRDDFDPGFPPDRPPLLNAGCAGALRWGTQSVGLSLGCKLSFTLWPRLPAPPPMPPAQPWPPSPPTTVAEMLNARFHKAAAEDGTAPLFSGVLLHQFDEIDDPNPRDAPWRLGRERPGACAHARVPACFCAPAALHGVPIDPFCRR